MTMQDRMMSWIAKGNEHVQSLTISIITGTACPCLVADDSDETSYNPGWHRANPAPGDEDCDGSGIIDPNKTTTVTNLKAMIFTEKLTTQADSTMDVILDQLGKIQATDLIICGCWDSDNEAYFSISGYNDRTAKITYDSKDYLIREVYTMPESVCQWARLVEKN